MAARLRQFKQDELLFDQGQSWSILKFFFLDPGVQPNSLTTKDRAFAQALLVEAIDASYDMGFIEIIFSVFMNKTPASTKGIAKLMKKFLEKTAEHWFRHATKDNLRNPRIYESVRVSLARNFSTPWRIRRNGLPLDY